MEESAVSERRTDPRVDVELRVDERVAEALYFQRATNLSAGGLYLAGTLPHPPGTAVTLDLYVPGEPGAVRVDAEVVAAAGEALGMGVRFVGVSATARAILSQFVTRSRAERSAARSDLSSTRSSP